MNARINGKKATDVITGDDATNYFENEFTPKVATRGGALIKKWGRSSAASTAVSIADAIRSLVQPTPEGDCFSSAVISDGNPYGVPEGIVYSFPLKSDGGGDWSFVRLYRLHPCCFWNDAAYLLLVPCALRQALHPLPACIAQPYLIRSVLVLVPSSMHASCCVSTLFVSILLFVAPLLGARWRRSCCRCLRHAPIESYAGRGNEDKIQEQD